MNPLLKFRTANAMTQAALAALLGKTKATVSRWEAGTRLPSPLNAVEIEEATQGQVRREDLRPDVFRGGQQ